MARYDSYNRMRDMDKVADDICIMFDLIADNDDYDDSVEWTAMQWTAYDYATAIEKAAHRHWLAMQTLNGNILYTVGRDYFAF